MARLVNHLINVLHPPARAEKKKEEERRRKREEEAAEQMKQEAKEQEEREAEERKRQEEAKKKQEEEEAEERRRQEAESASAAASMEVDQPASDIPDDVAEVMNLARSLAAGLAVPSTNSPTPDATRSATPSVPAQPIPSSSSTTEPSNAMEEEEEEPVAAAPETSGSGAQQPVERVTIMIHGEEVDITDTGVDREFLEALPDDMREEVLSQHFRETRSSGPPPAVPSHINSEFLDALPPDLRAEVLRQEAAEQRRQDEAAARANRGEEAQDQARDEQDEDEDRDQDQDQDQDDEGAGVALGGMDPAALLAGLVGQAAFGGPPPGAEGLPGFAEFMAQGAPGRRTGGDVARRLAGGPRGAGAGNPGGAAPPIKKSVPHREVIQLLDKSGLATLVRLLFFPQPLRRNSLQKVLVHLCENSRTRVELINLLLTILQDGTRDVSAVDKSFSQMSIRASKSLLAKDKDTPKRKVPETPGPSTSLPHFPGESVPNLIAQRCLEALAFLVNANDQTPLFFLTEQEVALSRRAAKKGKGKEKVSFLF